MEHLKNLLTMAGINGGLYAYINGELKTPRAIARAVLLYSGVKDPQTEDSTVQWLGKYWDAPTPTEYTLHESAQTILKKLMENLASKEGDKWIIREEANSPRWVAEWLTNYHHL